MSLILLDPHVHIYPQYDLKDFFDNLYANFLKQTRTKDIISFGIILTEKNEFNYYKQLSDISKIDKYSLSSFDKFLDRDFYYFCVRFLYYDRTKTYSW